MFLGLDDSGYITGTPVQVRLFTGQSGVERIGEEWSGVVWCVSAATLSPAGSGHPANHEVFVLSSAGSGPDQY